MRVRLYPNMTEMILSDEGRRNNGYFLPELVVLASHKKEVMVVVQESVQDSFQALAPFRHESDGTLATGIVTGVVLKTKH